MQLSWLVSVVKVWSPCCQTMCRQKVYTRKKRHLTVCWNLWLTMGATLHLFLTCLLTSIFCLQENKYRLGQKSHKQFRVFKNIHSFYRNHIFFLLLSLPLPSYLYFSPAFILFFFFFSHLKNFFYLYNAYIPSLH